VGVTDTHVAAGGGEGPPLPSRQLKAILEDHHGRLIVEPAGSTGTSYVASLPVRAVAAADEPKAPEHAGAAPEDFSLADRRVLIVDDDEDARETLGALLRAHGAAVESYGSGRAAYEHLHTEGRGWPDLMICDIGLPDEDGYTLLRRVRALEAERRLALADRMPAIALTGYARSEDRVRALVAGFQSHLVKPARPEDLLATVRRLLGAGMKRSRVGA
jgi:ATP-binding cassette subfamily B protein